MWAWLGAEELGVYPRSPLGADDLGRVPNGLAFVPNLYVGILTKPASRVAVRLTQAPVAVLLSLAGAPWDQQDLNTSHAPDI